MWSRLAVIGLCALVLAADRPAAEKSDLDKLQGAWKVESGSRAGMPLPDELTKSAKFVFEGNKLKMTIKMGDEERVNELEFKLDPSKKPKAIDVTLPDKKTGLGIYSLEGDTLKICHGEGDDPRPTDFESKEGSRQTVVVFKRVK